MQIDTAIRYARQRRQAGITGVLRADDQCCSMHNTVQGLAFSTSQKFWHELKLGLKGMRRLPTACTDTKSAVHRAPQRHAATDYQGSHLQPKFLAAGLEHCGGAWWHLSYSPLPPPGGLNINNPCTCCVPTAAPASWHWGPESCRTAERTTNKVAVSMHTIRRCVDKPSLTDDRWYEHKQPPPPTGSHACCSANKPEIGIHTRPCGPQLSSYTTQVV